MTTEAREKNLEILNKPSAIELYKSGLSASAWLLFLGVAVIIGGIVCGIIAYNTTGSSFTLLGVWFSAWVMGGFLGFIGFIAIFNTLKVERLKLATHMLRSLSLHAVLAYDKGGVEAVRRVAEAEQKEKGFIVRAFRAAGTNTEQAFAAGALEGVRRTSEPPYILVYRNGILDSPSTLVANLTARTIGGIIGILAFIILGIIMLVVGILLGSIVICTTARTLRNHARRENEVRRVLGLSETPTEAPGVGGLLASLLTLGLYLPIYARKLENSITTHILTH